MKGHSMDSFGKMFARHGMIMIGMMVLSIVAIVVAIVVGLSHGFLWGVALFFIVAIVGGAVLGIFMITNMFGGAKELLNHDAGGRPLPPPLFTETRHRL